MPKRRRVHAMLVDNVEDAVIATPERQRCYPRCSPPATATRRCFRRPGPTSTSIWSTRGLASARSSVRHSRRPRALLLLGAPADADPLRHGRLRTPLSRPLGQKTASDRVAHRAYCLLATSHVRSIPRAPAHVGATESYGLAALISVAPAGSRGLSYADSVASWLGPASPALRAGLAGR